MVRVCPRPPLPTTACPHLPQDGKCGFETHELASRTTRSTTRTTTTTTTEPVHLFGFVSFSARTEVPHGAGMHVRRSRRTPTWPALTEHWLKHALVSFPCLVIFPCPCYLAGGGSVVPDVIVHDRPHRVHDGEGVQHHHPGTRRGPFNFTPMGVNSISSGSPHVRPAPWGPSVRVVPDRQTKSRKIPTRSILPLFLVISP